MCIMLFICEDRPVSALRLTSSSVSANNILNQTCWTIAYWTRDKQQYKLLTVMNWGGSSRLDEPRMTSRFSFDVSLCAARNWKRHIIGYSVHISMALENCGCSTYWTNLWSSSTTNDKNKYTLAMLLEITRCMLQYRITAKECQVGNACW